MSLWSVLLDANFDKSENWCECDKLTFFMKWRFLNAEAWIHHWWRHCFGSSGNPLHRFRKISIAATDNLTILQFRSHNCCIDWLIDNIWFIIDSTTDNCSGKIRKWPLLFSFEDLFERFRNGYFPRSPQKGFLEGFCCLEFSRRLPPLNFLPRSGVC